MRYSYFHIAMFSLLLLAAVGCRSEQESASFQAFNEAFSRQSTALEILKTHKTEPDKAKAELEKLRSLHGDAIIALRENKEQLRKELSEKDQLYFEEVRDQLHEDLNRILSSYPASRVKELRYLLMTI